MMKASDYRKPIFSFFPSIKFLRQIITNLCLISGENFSKIAITIYIIKAAVCLSVRLSVQMSGCPLTTPTFLDGFVPQGYLLIPYA